MSGVIDLTLHALCLGAIATLVMDLGGWLRARLTGTPSLDYAMVGRWFGHMPTGTFLPDAIGRIERVPGETAIGWFAHYTIGVCFAATLVAITGPAPSLGASLLAGLLTSAAPLFVMQPAFGFGLAGAHLPRPAMVRMNTLFTHLTFGFGLFAGAKADPF